MSAWAVTMGAGETIGSCMRGLPFHPEDGIGPKSITVTPEMAKHNRGDGNNDDTVCNLATHHMQRFAALREADHQITFSSARIFVLFKHPPRQQGFFYFSHSQVVILS